MDVEIVGKFLSTLPEDDDHPYRTGPWRPQNTEWRADDLPAVEGEIPHDLDGIYLRNTENPLHPALKSYHPFDGDGMLHIVGFRDGKAFYRNRFVRTEAFEAEQDAGGPLWPGLAEPLSLAKVDHGWGARTLLKDASSTDVVVHRGAALTSFYQCGDLYRVDPYSGETQGKATWNGSFPFDWGVSAHPKVDERTDEMLFFNYSKKAPYLHYGVVDANNDLVHYVDVPLPGPRLPHDMAFTRNYAILNDFPLFWQPELLERNLHVPHFYQDMPSRFAVIPRRGDTGDIRWFEADPTFVLHFTNAYEDGDEIVLDGFYQGEPEPADNGTGTKWQRAFRFLALDRMQTRLHRWRLNLKTGATTEEPLSENISEFGMINAGHSGEPYRYVYAATGKPGWFLFDGLIRHDVVGGTEQRIGFGDGVYGSETAMAPRVGSRGEDDGYLVTLITDMNTDSSYCLVFDAARLQDGPVCKLQLPERISSGTHSTWVAGADVRRWRETDTAAAAVGL
jgi:carotenoid cleavage dioxygenase